MPDKRQKPHLPENMISRAGAVFVLKSDLIYIILEDDPDIKSELMQRLYDEISENIVPVRPDRHYERNKSLLHAKYSNTHKRSF